jgi:hypothetical protein
MTSKPPLQKILKGILYREDENIIIMKGQEVLNLMRRTDKYSNNNIESAAHTQILRQ